MSKQLFKVIYRITRIQNKIDKCSNIEDKLYLETLLNNNLDLYDLIRSKNVNR